MAHSPFTKLPAEVRLAVFELALDAPEDSNIIIFDDFRIEAMPTLYSFMELYIFSFALDAESLDVVYDLDRPRDCTPVFGLNTSFGASFTWFQHMGEQNIRKLRYVHMCIGTFNFRSSNCREHLSQVEEALNTHLARIICFFATSYAQVNLLFDIDIEYHGYGFCYDNVYLYVDNMESAYRTLDTIVPCHERDESSLNYLPLEIVEARSRQRYGRVRRLLDSIDIKTRYSKLVWNEKNTSSLSTPDVGYALI